MRQHHYIYILKQAQAISSHDIELVLQPQHQKSQSKHTAENGINNWLTEIYVFPGHKINNTGNSKQVFVCCCFCFLLIPEQASCLWYAQMFITPWWPWQQKFVQGQKDFQAIWSSWYSENNMVIMLPEHLSFKGKRYGLVAHLANKCNWKRNVNTLVHGSDWEPDISIPIIITHTMSSILKFNSRTGAVTNKNVNWSDLNLLEVLGSKSPILVFHCVVGAWTDSRLLHSPSRVAVRQSVKYETWPARQWSVPRVWRCRLCDCLIQIYIGVILTCTGF